MELYDLAYLFQSLDYTMYKSCLLWHFDDVLFYPEEGGMFALIKDDGGELSFRGKLRKMAKICKLDPASVEAVLDLNYCVGAIFRLHELSIEVFPGSNLRHLQAVWLELARRHREHVMKSTDAVSFTGRIVEGRWWKLSRTMPDKEVLSIVVQFKEIPSEDGRSPDVEIADEFLPGYDQCELLWKYGAQAIDNTGAEYEWELFDDEISAKEYLSEAFGVVNLP